MRKKTSTTIGALCAICVLLSPFASAQEEKQPQLHEEVVVRWWLVPVYAIDKAGAPVLSLSSDDLEVYIKGIRVEPFTLHKKQFRAAETKKAAAPAEPEPLPQSQAPPQKKMVFLVFDEGGTPFGFLKQSKTMCEGMIAQSDKAAQYVLLTLERFAGLHYICGPTQDLKLLGADLRKLVYSKRLPGEPNALDDNYIRVTRPSTDSWRTSTGGGLTPPDFLTSLRTLSLILGYFRDYSKVVYIYSTGVPFPVEPLDLDALLKAARSLNDSGAILFLINPAGTRVFESDASSGEPTLRLLANETGGRYYEGEEKKIVQSVNDMEGGYYEISFPDKPEYEGQELSFEIRSKKPEVMIYTLRNVGREKSFAAMNELERQLLVLNVLNNGPNALIKERTIYVEAQRSREGASLVCRLALPAELARSEFTVFKVARDFETGDIQVEAEPVIPGSAKLEVRMKWRGDAYRYDVVLADARTGTILVGR
jgi:hypothetical protein